MSWSTFSDSGSRLHLKREKTLCVSSTGTFRLSGKTPGAESAPAAENDGIQYGMPSVYTSLPSAVGSCLVTIAEPKSVSTMDFGSRVLFGHHRRAEVRVNNGDA